MKPSVLTRYRALAYITAVTLLVFCVFIILDRGFGIGDTMVISQIHGLLYLIYVVFAFDLGLKAKWPMGKLLWVLVAGCLPTVAFFVERRIHREVTPLLATGPSQTPANV
ncbi:hypothetical protein AQ490_20835 [Wenjunlia vitaminophila]|uniref:DUF3817 domain-containing protein n=1 Tax=Wenjunlia vitaminophila TaxID=76728 RepID=A0A0T6LTF0_WENVI|nr:DUF3817 domain-containing protein [Wenjunlia vitaminophila]KRV49431.1 hypothetical protein AQ490_20835 [Wenjunlia vitaminophila]